MRAEHLKELILADAAGDFLSALTAVVNLLAAGRATQTVRAFVAGASLVPFNKKEPGGIRPIAVGLTLRRLTAKVLLAREMPTAREVLAPHQFGIGTPGGAELIIHRLRRLVEEQRPEDNDDFVVLKIDVKNAFNSVDRTLALQAVGEYLPNLAAWAEWCYDSDTTLFLEDHRILSAEGVQQGDPLGPLLFALSIRDAIGSLDQFALAANFWYLDDGVLAGPAATVHAA
jgi:hypothetical protein